MDPSQLLNLLIHGNQLKRTVRTGWLQRGIAKPEDVAAHSFGVVFIALVMAEVISETLDLETLLVMAILHDLPEALTSDIPTPAWRFLPPGTKLSVEREAMRTVFGDLSSDSRLVTCWESFCTNDSAETRLIHDCDKLDMYLQAYMYEQQSGNLQLAEFWEQPHKFSFEATQAVFDELSSLRNQE